MADLLYTTPQAVTDLAGELAVELRTDDGSDQTEMDGFVDSAIEYASSRIDFYIGGRVAASELAVNRWVAGVATVFALHWLCLRRLNSAPGALETERTERLEELKLIQQGKAQVPGAARSRRPITLTNQRVDLNRPNHQIRTDRTRSTGVAKDYPRRTDPGAETLGDR